MRYSATSVDKHLAHKKSHAKSHTKSHAKSPLRQIGGFLFFIITAIIAAGIVTTIIRTNRIDIVRAKLPQVGISVPELRATNTPHDDICGSGIDDYNFGATNNIKGFFDHGIMGNDCIARQMNGGVELGDRRDF